MAWGCWEVQKLTVQNIACARLSPPHLFPKSSTETIQADWLFPAADVKVKHHEQEEYLKCTNAGKKYLH